MDVKKIYDFHCPRWNELPETEMFNKEVVSYVNSSFRDILNKEDYLTTTMVQNYLKWGIVDSPKGRKYNKGHIAKFIVVLIYKQVLNINDVAKGMDLMLNQVSIDYAYDLFAKSLEDALKREFSFLIEGEEYKFEGKKIADKYIGMYAVSESFVTRLLASIVMNSKEIRNIGDNNE